MTLTKADLLADLLLQSPAETTAATAPTEPDLQAQAAIAPTARTGTETAKDEEDLDPRMTDHPDAMTDAEQITTMRTTAGTEIGKTAFRSLVLLQMSLNNIFLLTDAHTETTEDAHPALGIVVAEALPLVDTVIHLAATDLLENLVQSVSISPFRTQYEIVAHTAIIFPKTD